MIKARTRAATRSGIVNHRAPISYAIIAPKVESIDATNSTQWVFEPSPTVLGSNILLSFSHNIFFDMPGHNDNDVQIFSGRALGLVGRVFVQVVMM
jgi:hypothetical protein